MEVNASDVIAKLLEKIKELTYNNAILETQIELLKEKLEERGD